MKVVKSTINSIIAILVILLSTNAYSFTKPPPPAKTGSDTLDAINNFIYDTVNWQMGDSIPNTGSSTLNAIARSMLNVANHGCTGTSSDGSYISCTPKPKNGFGGSGASGSWGSDGDNDPYSGNGGLQPPQNSCYYYADNLTAPTPKQLCYSISSKEALPFFDLRNVRDNIYSCRIGTTGSSSWTISYKCDNKCPTAQFFNAQTNKCEIQCPERQIFDANTNQCVIDPNQCLSPYTLINGICVPPKKPDPEDERCPYGYEKQGNLCIAKPPKGDCDPTIQNCDENNNSNDCSEICPRLDTIIRNQGTQIQQQNTTNRTLSEILAEQKTTNLKLDAISQKLAELNHLTQSTNTNLQTIQQQLAVIEKLLKDGIRLDIEPILKKVDEVIANDNKNHEDLTGLIARGLIQQKDGKTKPYLQIIAEEHPNAIASAVASTVKPITDNQEKQTKVLEDIKDLLNVKKDDKENPLPDPTTPESIFPKDYDPFGAIKGYNISQNRINASKQCPADKNFLIMGYKMTIPMSYLCDFLAMLAPIFLSLAYFKGAMIIIRS